MADIKTLRETMANIATEARSKLSEITDETPEARASEIEREFDAMMAETDKLQGRIDREERAAALMAKLEQPDTSKIPMFLKNIAFKLAALTLLVALQCQLNWRHLLRKLWPQLALCTPQICSLSSIQQTGARSAFQL